MRSTERWVVAGALLMAGLGPWDDARAGVVNGDFETPAVTNSGPPAGFGFDYRTSLTGWTIHAPVHGIVLFDARYRPVGGGLQSIQLEYADDYIEQAIATIVGQSYLLSFALSAYAPPGTSTLEVEIGALPTQFFSGASASYATYTIPFVASAASTLVHFENGGAASPFTYPHVDNISVTAAPEPASLALLGLALAGLGMTRLRTKSRRPGGVARVTSPDSPAHGSPARAPGSDANGKGVTRRA